MLASWFNFSARRVRAAVLVSLSFGALIAGFSQTAPLVPPRENDVTKPSSTVTLPSFIVSTAKTSPYNAREATSTTRISIPLQDIAQSVSVVTRQLIDDTQGFRMLDVAKYVTTLGEGAPSGGDRYVIRGFQTTQRFIDGVNVSGLDGYNMTSDMSNVERLEINKGPNAILVPGGGFGGIINQITKEPKFEDFTEVSARYTSYLGSGVTVDANRVIGERRSAVRVVGSYWDSTGYFQDSYRKGYLVAPSFTYVFGGGAELLVKIETLKNDQSAGQGISLDPSVGTKIGGYARPSPFLPRDNSWAPGDDRQRWETRLYSELRFKLGDIIAARLWFMADTAERNDHGAPGGQPVAGNQGGVNPLTGEYVPFNTFSYNPTTQSLTTTTLTPSTDTRFNRVNQANRLIFNELHFKNDYAAQYEIRPGIIGTSIAGLSANYSRVEWKSWNTRRPQVDYASGARVGLDEPIIMTLVRDKEAAQEDVQAFVYQRVNLLQDRLIAAAGVSRFYGSLQRLDNSPVSPPILPSTRNATTDLNYGIIYKPVRAVSLFAGYNRVGGALPSSIQAGDFTTGGFRIGVGDQTEYGIKTSFLKDRITASLAYFDISQSNVTVPNSGFATNPSLPQFLFFDLENQGWELEFNALITPNWAILGNYTIMDMRDTYGIPQRMVPERAGAVFTKYTFTSGATKGLGLTLGIDHVGKVAGDQVTLFTSAGVPNQPSFYVAPRTLVQAGLSYRRDRWSVALVVRNVLDKDYVQASQNRNFILMGEPRNYSLSAEYKF
jgi:iron complex outermembrane receptor protein